MEALVWNTKMRVERSVEVASNGMGLLNGQTTKRDSLVSVEEVGAGLFTEQGCRIWDRHQVDLGHVPKVLGSR
jgi:hypothetical protein